MENEQLYKQIIKKFGNQKQIIKTIEELSELQKDLCKFLLYQSPLELQRHMENVAGEIADVEIMLNQLKIMFAPGMPELVETMKSQKHERMLKLL